MKKLRVLYIYAGDANRPGWMTQEPQVNQHIEWSTLGVEAGASLQRVIKALTHRAALQSLDLIISSEYFLAFGVNLRLLLTACSTPHVIWGLNQSRKTLAQPFVHSLSNRVFGRSDFVITHSRAEASMFQKLHALPSKKFKFVPWGFDLPNIDPRPFLEQQVPYVCLVGRNNRDLETFALACDMAKIQGVVITSTVSADVRDMLQARQILLFENLSFERCLACIRDGLFSAVLLNDDDRGAGHITMVAAMLLGKAQVVSDAQVIKDYVHSPEHAVKVPLRDPQACAQAFQQLANHEALRNRMGEAAREHARLVNSNQAVANHLLALASSLKRD